MKIDAVQVAVSRALEYLTLKREVTRLRATSDRDRTIDGIAGDSSAIREMVEMVRRVADSDASVLITGESGTGKELVARALHNLSPRREQPFVAVNCAAMPASLLESELFGHVRGAFTNAKQDRKGLFVRAGAGTILLDEIGEMPTEMQVKLLRVLQQHTVRPVGGNEEVTFEARVITSTNRDLEAEVAEKRFREDLFYRINVVQIAVPPLRDRAGDILSLAQHFVEQIAARSKKPVRGLSPLRPGCSWTTTGRATSASSELYRARGRTVPARRDHHRRSAHQGAATRELEDRDSTASPSELITMDEMERRYLRQVLAAVGGNKTHAARIGDGSSSSTAGSKHHARSPSRLPRPARGNALRICFHALGSVGFLGYQVPGGRE